jgi:hypothetical protein
LLKLKLMRLRRRQLKGTGLPGARLRRFFLCLTVDPRIDSAVTTWRITLDPLAFGPASALGLNISHSGGRPDWPVALPCGAKALPKPAARTLSPWL